MNKVVRASPCRRLVSKSQLTWRLVDNFPRPSVRRSSTGRKLSDEEEDDSKHWLPPRQASIVTPHPEETTVEHVLTTLRQFRMSNRYWGKFSKRASSSAEYYQALVILATPSYAKWIVDDKFVSQVLDSIFRPTSQDLIAKNSTQKDDSAANKPPLEIDIICACVDGLAPSVESIPEQNSFPLQEGFSFLHGRTNQIIPGLSDPGTTKTSNIPGMQSSLTFSTEDENSEVTLPLANTLFKNGRNSTLLASRWQQVRTTKDCTYTKIKCEEKTNQRINVFNNSPMGIPSSSITLIPLTPARRIISGLGNIVRQIQFDDGKGPASQELETNIDEYLKVINCPNSTVKVWALVIPIESLPDSPPDPPNDLLLDEDSIQKLWGDSLRRVSLWTNPDQKRSTFVGHWVDRGATLCRVLSGGGGWGAKQGLLSLDPQTSYKIPNEARFDFSTGSLEEQQDAALGSIAHPNAFIQFFVANSDKNSFLPTRVLRGNEIFRTKDPFQRSTVIGAVPSTIDDIPLPPSIKKRTGKELSITTFASFRVGHFGAVSESGMFYHSTVIKDTASEWHITAQHPISTKIDVPYSFFFRKFSKKFKFPIHKPGKGSLPIRYVLRDRDDEIVWKPNATRLEGQ